MITTNPSSDQRLQPPAPIPQTDPPVHPQRIHRYSAYLALMSCSEDGPVGLKALSANKLHEGRPRYEWWFASKHPSYPLARQYHQPGMVNICPSNGGEIDAITAGHKMETKTGTQECAGCGKVISERYMLKALDLYWHEDCLKCGCCDCRLGEVGSTLYTKANLILCRRDYLRLFGSTGYCAACSKVIPAFEMVMRARTNVYHLECFACQQCNHRFCVGDRFYLCDNKILCEYDYEERLVFANMAYNPNQLAQLKRQANGQIPSPSIGAGPVRSIGSGDLNNNMSQGGAVLKAPTS